MTTTSPTAPTPAVTGPPLRDWVVWLASFLGFPLGGLVATVFGGVDDVPTALLGGAVAGAVIGSGQWLALRRLVPGTSWAWVPATAVGLALGLAAGSAAVGYQTGAGDLIVQGMFSGLFVGGAQALVLRAPLGSGYALGWAGAALGSWPIGWSVTRAFGIDVANRYAVFGASGAIAYTVHAGLVLALLLALARRSATRRAA